MDFSRLPDTALLKIIEYLPLENRIRVGRVDKSFRRIARLATSRTKSLELDEDRFRNLTDDQLTVILDLCSSNLERVKLGGVKEQDSWIRINWNEWNQGEWAFYSASNHRIRQLATTLANYECSRLIDFDLGHSPIDYAVFAQLIRNNQNLESLVWKADFIGYPPNITNNRMKKLGLYVTNASTLRSLIRRFPNLKELDLTMEYDIITPNISLLNQFFGSTPQLNHFNLDTCRDFEMADVFRGFDFNFYEKFENELANFWNLLLTSLSIRLPKGSFGDGILHKLASSFKNLKKLQLDMLAPTNDSIASLSALQDLEILELNIMWNMNRGGRPFDQGIGQLVHCEKLQKLGINKAIINGGTLINLLRSCPQLEYVGIWEISEVSNPEEVAVVLGCLAGIVQRHINIEICSNKAAIKCIWDGEPVKEAIAMLEEMGLKIKIIWVNSDTMID